MTYIYEEANHDKFLRQLYKSSYFKKYASKLEQLKTPAFYEF